MWQPTNLQYNTVKKNINITSNFKVIVHPYKMHENLSSFTKHPILHFNKLIGDDSPLKNYGSDTQTQCQMNKGHWILVI
jgi:hypothetical protein